MSRHPKCADAIEALHQAIVCSLEQKPEGVLEEARFGRFSPESGTSGWHWHLKFAVNFDQEGQVTGDTAAERIRKILHSWDSDRLKYEEAR